jgi:hypothetical protein
MKTSTTESMESTEKKREISVRRASVDSVVKSLEGKPS